jgi:hypothetical protein
VAGTTLFARASEEAPGLRLAAKLAPFVPSRGQDIRLRVSSEAVPEPGAPPLFESGGIWQVFPAGTGLFYRFRSPSGRGPAARGLRIDRGWSRGTLYLPPSTYSRRRGFALSYPLDELLFAHHFAHRRATVVHGCGLVADGRGLLFCGHSGAGKTTTALLWRKYRRGTEVLSDDRIVVRFRAGRPWIFGTPWHGSGRFAQPRGVPLAGVFFLRQAERSRLSDLAVPGAAAHLFARSFPPPWSGTAIDRVLSLCARVARTVPCRTLSFARDETAVRAVTEALD